MNRISMRATAAFTLGTEEIGEGDILALTEPEAAALMAKGWATPYTAQQGTTDLNDGQLGEMRDALLGYAELAAHSDAFRQHCQTTANRIDDYLRGDKSCEREVAAGIEEAFGTLAPAEITRLERMAELHEAVDQAYTKTDWPAWKSSFVELLEHLSEEHAEFLMAYIASMRDAVVLDQEQAELMHPMPAGMQ